MFDPWFIPYYARVERSEEGKGYDVFYCMVSPGGYLQKCGLKKHFRLKREAQAEADLFNYGDEDEFTDEEFNDEDLDEF